MSELHVKNIVYECQVPDSKLDPYHSPGVKIRNLQTHLRVSIVITVKVLIYYLFIR
jgi:hypothetical protein